MRASRWVAVVALCVASSTLAVSARALSKGRRCLFNGRKDAGLTWTRTLDKSNVLLPIN